MESFDIAGNRLCHIDGHWFAFAVDCAAIFEIDPGIARPLLESCSGDGFDKHVFFSKLKGDQAQKEAVVRDLVDCRILDCSGTVCDRPKPFGHVEAKDIPLQTLVLHVTDACNLDCVYCYRSIRKQGARHQRTMDAATARAAIDLLFEHSGSCQEVVVVFFGGEPFLNVELISTTAAYARQKAHETGKIVQFAVTTNGTLLTPEAVRCIDEYHIGVTVSIDGYDAIHDRARPFADGSASSPRVLEGLNTLFAQRGLRPVAARVTVTQHPEAVPEILAFLLEQGFTEVGFAPVTSVDTAFQLSDDGMHTLLASFRSLAEDFLSRARRDEVLGFSNLIDLLVILHQGEIKDYPCGAGLGLFAVAPDGRLYICQRLTDEEHCCMGTVTDGFDREHVVRFRANVMAKRHEQCRRCWVRKICAGGCYHEALVRQGGIAEPNRHYCQWITQWISIGLEVYGKLAVSNPEFLDRLSLIRGHMPVSTSVA